MARVSIYIPDDLKARMDKVGEAANWSEVARPAFLATVAEHEHRKGQDMTTVKERLRASKEKLAQVAAQSGRKDGRTWAANTADYAELYRVSQISDENEDIGALSQAIDPNEEMDHNVLCEYLGDIAQELSNSSSDEFIQGFIQGAKELFDEVKDDL